MAKRRRCLLAFLVLLFIVAATTIGALIVAPQTRLGNSNLGHSLEGTEVDKRNCRPA